MQIDKGQMKLVITDRKVHTVYLLVMKNRPVLDCSAVYSVKLSWILVIRYFKGKIGIFNN